jgi:hypothetical protein
MARADELENGAGAVGPSGRVCAIAGANAGTRVIATAEARDNVQIHDFVMTPSFSGARSIR